MNKNNNLKGYTLIELLVVTGLISVAGLGLYGVYQISEDNRKVKTASQSLNNTLRDLENYSLAKGNLTGISLATIRNHSQNFNPVLELNEIISSNDEVSFNYKNVNIRICNDFVSKMLSSDKNISAKINNTNISNNNLSDISGACLLNGEVNDISMIYKQPIDSKAINTVIASVNIPPPPAIDVVVPATPTPAILPKVPAFVPPTTTPVTYGITGTAPVYPVVSPSGGPISVTPGGSSGGSVTPPTWTPPGYTPAPPATGAPVDDIDQNVLPPPPPPPAPPPGPDFSVGNVITQNFNAYANPFYDYTNDPTYRWYPNYASASEKDAMFKRADYQAKQNISSTFTIREVGWGVMRPNIPGFFGWDMSNPQTCSTSYWRADYSEIPISLRSGYFSITTSDYLALTYIIHVCRARFGGS